MNTDDRKLIQELTEGLYTLTDRNSYVAWRNRWRQALAAQTILVRQIRKARKLLGSPSDKPTDEVQWAKDLMAGLTKRQSYNGNFYGWNSWRHLTRDFGHQLAELRKLSKEKARESYAARKAEELKARSA